MSIFQVLFNSYKPYGNLPEDTDRFSKLFINASYDACVTMVNISPNKTATFRKLCALESMLLLIAIVLAKVNDKNGSIAFLISHTLEKCLLPDVIGPIKSNNFSISDRIAYYKYRVENMNANPDFLPSDLIYAIYEAPLVPTKSRDMDKNSFIDVSKGVVCRDMVFSMNFMKELQKCVEVMKKNTLQQ